MRQHIRLYFHFWVTLLLLISLRAGHASPNGPISVLSQQPLTLDLIRLTDPVSDPKQQDVLYFPATGHTLRGVFKDYWQRYGGLAQFGYPLTEEFFEPSEADGNSLQVQYFERNRFELHPENKGTPYEVLLGILGREFRAQDTAVPQQTLPALYFPETGHNLTGKFREYWESHGGLFVHGYPITEAQTEKNPTDDKDYLVQWFERSRFELHPENASSQYEVLLGLLGVQLVQKKGYSVGVYPLHGHAADFSWVAGQITIYGFIGFTDEKAGCAILQYGATDERVQLNRADGNALNLSSGQESMNLVAFGHLRNHTETAATLCDLDRGAPIFRVERKLQSNSTP